LMTTMSVVGECFFWYQLTRVVLDKFHRAVKRLCTSLHLTTKRQHFISYTVIFYELNPTSEISLNAQKLADQLFI